MNKKIFLILTLLILTGCSSTAKINIEKDYVSEDITFYANNTNEFNQAKNWKGFPLPIYYDQDLNNPFGDDRSKESGVSYYEQSVDTNKKTVNATARFKLDEHTRSSIIRGCFKYYNIIPNIETGNTIFYTSDGLICNFNNFDVVITTPYKVTKNNASKVDTNSNTYTWNVNSKNRNNVSIYLEIDFTKKADGTSTENNNDNNNNNNNTNNTEKKQNNKTYLIIFITIIPIIILIVAYILKKKKDALDRV